MEILPVGPVKEIIELNNNKKKFNEQNPDKNPQNNENKDQPKEPGKGNIIDIKI